MKYGNNPQNDNSKGPGIGDQNDGGIFVNLTVPLGTEAGVDSLTFEYDAKELEVLVPAGSVAGDVLRIQVGFVGGSNAGDEFASASAGDGNKSDEEPKPSSSLMDEMGGMNDDEATSSNHDEIRSGGSPLELNATKNGYDCSSEQVKGLQERKEISRDATTRSIDGLTVVEMGDGLIQEIGTTKGEGEQSTTSLHLLEYLPSTDNLAGNNNINEGDGTNRMVWSSGTVLAQALTSSFGLEFLTRLFNRDNHQQKKDERITVKCLELGSGLGACGLALSHALASCCRSNSIAKDDDAKNNAGENDCGSVLLTDQGDTAVDLIKGNIQRNFPPSCITIGAESLIWGNDPLQCKHSSGGDEKFHLILGSDLLYNSQESYEPLIKTIKEHLHPEQGILLLAVRWRKPDLEREFFRRAEKMTGLKFELWQEFIESKDFEKRSPCRLNWREYGHAGNESSNKYFHETTISTGKTKTSLANITEQDMESMNDEEYSAFEELQVQVYVGKYDGEESISRKRQR